MDIKNEFLKYVIKHKWYKIQMLKKRYAVKDKDTNEKLFSNFLLQMQPVSLISVY